MDKIEKKYVWEVATWIIVAALLFGFIAPMMISARSNELVIGGIILILLYVGLLINRLINIINKTHNEEDD